MKKYLLTALLGVFGLCTAFVSADYNIIGEGEDIDSHYSPENVSFSNFDFDSSKVNFVCPSGNCFISFQDEAICSITYSNGNLTFDNTEGDGCSNMNGDFFVAVDPSYNVFSSFSICPSGCSSSSEGGNSSGGSSSLISGGINQLSPVITSISNVMSEFIPYVVYIGIGILLVTLGFKAIKRLVNWLSSKITRYFK